MQFSAPYIPSNFITTAMIMDAIVTEAKLSAALQDQLLGFGETGDVIVSFKSTAPNGWISMDDGTIGNASSGGTTRANADTEDLFTLLWNGVGDSYCPVSSGRGASAAADFAANKTIALPRALGRAIMGSGAGSGLTLRALGQYLGSEDAIVVTHNHSVTDPGHAHTMADPDGMTPGATSMLKASGSLISSGSSTTGISIDNAGSSGTDKNTQPSICVNYFIKL